VVRRNPRAGDVGRVTRRQRATAVPPADGVWRVAFAFDPKRNAVLLIAGDKSGGSEKRFYRQLIAKAGARLDEHLSRTKKKGT